MRTPPRGGAQKWHFQGNERPPEDKPATSPPQHLCVLALRPPWEILGDLVARVLLCIPPPEREP